VIAFFFEHALNIQKQNKTTAILPTSNIKTPPDHPLGRGNTNTEQRKQRRAVMIEKKQTKTKYHWVT
jgi:hypothetical protein